MEWTRKSSRYNYQVNATTEASIRIVLDSKDVQDMVMAIAQRNDFGEDTKLQLISDGLSTLLQQAEDDKQIIIDNADSWTFEDTGPAGLLTSAMTELDEEKELNQESNLGGFQETVGTPWIPSSTEQK